MKKLLLVSLSLLLTVGVLTTPAFASNNDGEDGYKFGKGGFWGQWTKSNPDIPGSEDFEENVATEDGTNALLETVKTAVNWILGLLAFIALLFLLFGGFKVLTAGTDEKALGDAWKIVKNAGLGILMIAVSWIIVTFIFYIAGILTEDTGTENDAIGGGEGVGTQNAGGE